MHDEKGTPFCGFDSSALEKVLALSDEELKQAVHSLAIAGGAGERRAAEASRDANKIRKKLNRVTQGDLEKLLSRITPEQMKELSTILNDMKS